MTISFHPDPGTILLCDYSTGFIEPEMVKRRPAVVLSARLRNRDFLCAVVPLSTTAPDTVEAYHVHLRLIRPLPKPFSNPAMWAKCDMLATVAFERLTPFGIGRNPAGQRRYVYPKLTAEQFAAVRKSVLAGLGL